MSGRETGGMPALPAKRRRLTLVIDPDAFERLSDLAAREHRPPRLQALHLLERALARTATRPAPLRTVARTA